MSGHTTSPSSDGSKPEINVHYLAHDYIIDLSSDEDEDEEKGKKLFIRFYFSSTFINVLAN